MDQMAIAHRNEGIARAVHWLDAGGAVRLPHFSPSSYIVKNQHGVLCFMLEGEKVIPDYRMAWDDLNSEEWILLA